MPKVHAFPKLPALTGSTRIPAAQRSALDDPEDLHWTPADMVDYLRSIGFLVISGTRYNSDAEAQADGLSGTAYIAGDRHLSASPNTLIFLMQ